MSYSKKSKSEPFFLQLIMEDKGKAKYITY